MITEKAWKVLEAAREYREAMQRFAVEADPEASDRLLSEALEAGRALKAAAMEMGE